MEEEQTRPPLIRFGLKRKLRLALAVENRFADFQGSGLRLRFSSASVAPDRKKTTRTAFLIERSLCDFQFGLLRFFLRSPICPHPATLLSRVEIKLSFVLVVLNNE